MYIYLSIQPKNTNYFYNQFVDDEHILQSQESFQTKVLPYHISVKQKESQLARETKSGVNFPRRQLDETLMMVCNLAVVTHGTHIVAQPKIWLFIANLIVHREDMPLAIQGPQSTCQLALPSFKSSKSSVSLFPFIQQKKKIRGSCKTFYSQHHFCLYSVGQNSVICCHLLQGILRIVFLDVQRCEYYITLCLRRVERVHFTFVNPI